MKILGTTMKCTGRKEECYYTQLATEALLVTNQMARFIHSCQKKAQQLLLVQSHQNKCRYIYWSGF